MNHAKHEFTNLTNLNAEALGEPGERTFRILVSGGNNSAIMWLEKEQLFQLALAVQQLLATNPDENDTTDEPLTGQEVTSFVTVDFKVGKLVLAHEDARSLFIIDAHAMEEDEETTPTVRVWANRNQAKGFADRALSVCAAGRPLCLLCGKPKDATGHKCPRVNGHVTNNNL